MEVDMTILIYIAASIVFYGLIVLTGEIEWFTIE